MEMRWSEGMVKLAVRAHICGPLAIHKHLDVEDDYALSHVGTGYSLAQIVDAVSVNTENLDDMKGLAERLIASIPNIEELLEEVYSRAPLERRKAIGKIFIEAAQE